MKQLVCEMCGSSDLLKQDGVFICQTCGTKYSVEEAKKMMVEGKVEVTGTVQIDKTNQIKGYLEVIERAYKGRDGKTAYEYSNKALEADPENPDVLIARVKAVSLIEITNDVFRNELRDIATKIKKYNDKAYKEFYKNRSEDDDSEYSHEVILKLFTVFIQVSLDLAKDVSAFYDKSFNLDDKVRYEILKQKCLRLCCCNTMIYTTRFDLVVNRVDIYSLKKLIDECEECKQNYQRCAVSVLTGIKSPSNPLDRSIHFLKDIVKTIEKSQEEAKAKKNRERNEKYWLEHQEEKQQLEAEKNSLSPRIEELQRLITEIKNKINELNRQKESSVPAEEEYKSLQSKIYDLKMQMNNLGIFKGKQKKELQAQIDEGRAKLEHINSEITSQKEQLLSSINPKISALNNECSELEKESSNLKSKVSKIDTELTKQR